MLTLNQKNGLQFLANIESHLTLSSDTFDGCSVEFRRRRDETTLYIEGECLMLDAEPVIFDQILTGVCLHSDGTISIALNAAYEFDDYENLVMCIDLQPYEAVKASFSAVDRLIPRTAELGVLQTLQELTAEMVVVLSRHPTTAPIDATLLQKFATLQEVLTEALKR